MKKLKVWINACEVSGDLQASLLLKQLNDIYPSLEVVGMGGEQLKAQGQENYFHISELSVMGITEIISAIPKIFGLWKRIKSKMLEAKPDVIILVDSGEFNFPLAKFAKKNNIPVYYFIPPKVWAWRQYRVKYLKKYVDKILCILPFEVDYYKGHGIDASYIENPLVQALMPYKAKKFTQDSNNTINFAIMPGSRKKEVSSLLPFFAQVSKALYEIYPNATFSIIQAPNFTKEYLDGFWNSIENLPQVQYIEAKERYSALAQSHFCLAASGTATLETALIRLPTIIAYQVSSLSFFIANYLVNLTHVGLASLIARHEVFPEYLQKDMVVENVVNNLELWINDSQEIDKLNKEFDYVAALLASDKNMLNIFDNLM